MEALAVKYRPKSFVEVVGQNTVISILSAQIENDTFKNSYLFVGPSGCGKTTVARMFANYVNNDEGEPIEINGASNNGVDNIRNIIVDSQQSAIDSKYKVYIIDECHQLTKAAWDASLKLIEEPPSNAIFIFCTTNSNKIPETIMTRVQRFDFKRISLDEISNRLEYILNEEFYDDVKVETRALRLIAKRSNGLMRDAITMLDKCISYSKEITLENVEKVIGQTNIQTLFNITNSLFEGDNKYIEYTNELITNNTNMLNVIDDFLQLALDMSLFKKMNDKSLVIYNDDEIAFMNNYTQEFINILIDRIFKFRQLVEKLDSITLFNVLMNELSRWKNER